MQSVFAMQVHNLRQCQDDSNGIPDPEPIFFYFTVQHIATGDENHPGELRPGTLTAVILRAIMPAHRLLHPVKTSLNCRPEQTNVCQKTNGSGKAHCRFL